METTPKPDELERALTARPRAEPSKELRHRVRTLVRGELRRPSTVGWWSFAAELAAVMLLWINLSWGAVGETAYNLVTVPDADSWAVVVKQIEQLAPELSPQDARRQALLMSARANLTSGALAPPPTIYPSGSF
jgi:hypothetical protein